LYSFRKHQLLASQFDHTDPSMSALLHCTDIQFSTFYQSQVHHMVVKAFKGTVNLKTFHPVQNLEFKLQHHSRVNFHFSVSGGQKTHYSGIIACIVFNVLQNEQEEWLLT
jgi:hypothetical protein